MLDLNHVSKHFGALAAVDDVSLHLPEGEVVGLLGPNGAGKTTLFRLMCGLLYPDRGQIVFPARRGIGYKPERLLFPNQVRVTEYLEMVGRLCNLDRSHASSAAARALDRVGLSGAARKRIRECSKGMRQRLGMAQVLVGDPALLFLDEPSNGLDPEGQNDIGRVIRELRAEGRTIVVSSHQLSEVTRVCTRVAIVDRGRVHYESSLDEALAARPRVTIRAAQDLEPLRSKLVALHPGVQVRADEVVLEGDAMRLRREVLRLILESGVDVCHVEQQRRTLDEIYSAVLHPT